MLSDRCPVLSCLSCLSATSVYCSQTVGWVKMKLGMQVGLGPGHIVLDGDSAPPQKGAHPNFRPNSIVAKRLDGSRCHLVGRYGSAHATAGWMKTPLGTEVDLGPDHTVLYIRRPSSPPQKGHSSPLFSAHVCCGHGRPSQLLLSSWNI